MTKGNIVIGYLYTQTFLLLKGIILYIRLTEGFCAKSMVFMIITSILNTQIKILRKGTSSIIREWKAKDNSITWGYKTQAKVSFEILILEKKSHACKCLPEFRAGKWHGIIYREIENCVAWHLANCAYYKITVIIIDTSKT